MKMHTFTVSNKSKIMGNENIIYFQSKAESNKFLKDNNFRFYMCEGCDLTFINDDLKVCLRRYESGETAVYKR
jgi:hypothetical protein